MRIVRTSVFNLYFQPNAGIHLATLNTTAEGIN
jgi:hypothetical protein